MRHSHVSSLVLFTYITLIVQPWGEQIKLKIYPDIKYLSTRRTKIINLYSKYRTAQMPPINIRSHCYSIVAQGRRTLRWSPP